MIHIGGRDTEHDVINEEVGKSWFQTTKDKKNTSGIYRTECLFHTHATINLRT